jgi:nitrogen-specific signal transduction histidine kinase
MKEADILAHLLDSWNKPVVLVDTNHTIVYMNAPARVSFAKWGEIVGKSIFHCHNEQSSRIIRDVFEKLEKGQDEVLIADNERHRVYMRAVRDRDGRLVGYYERYDPPLGK